MYIKWIPAVLFGSCLLVGTGLFAGTRMEIGRNQKLNQYSDQIRTTIAVVNQDVGADNCGVKENYSAAIIDTLGSEYVLVSPQEAQNGYESGRYGAVLMFPSDLSKKVLSINTWEPERVGLEFMINSSLPEGKYINLYTKIIGLQSKINESLSYTYVASLYDEFHGAQDSTKELFDNDKADMEAAGKVKLTNFTEQLNLHDAPRTVFEAKEIDFQEFVNQVRGYAEELSGQYQESYQKARDEYEIVQSNTLNYSGRIRDDSIEWQGQVDDWGMKVDDYGRALEEYSHKLDTWITEAEKWQDETVKWNEQIEVYQKDVDDWRVKSDQTLSDYRQDWEIKTQEIDGKLKTYCSDLNEYKANVDAYRDAVAVYAGVVFKSGGTYAVQTAGVEADKEEEAQNATGSEALKVEAPPDKADVEGLPGAGAGDNAAEKLPGTGAGDNAAEKLPVAGAGDSTAEKLPGAGAGDNAAEELPGAGTGDSAEEKTLDSEVRGGVTEKISDSDKGCETEEQKPYSDAAKERERDRSEGGEAAEWKPDGSEGNEAEKTVEQKAGEKEADSGIAFQITGKMAMFTTLDGAEEEDTELDDEGEVWLINDLTAEAGSRSIPPNVTAAAAAAEASSQKVKDFPDIPVLPVLALDLYAGTPKPDFQGGMAPALDKQIPQNEAGNFPQLPDELTEALRNLENEVLVYDAGNYLDGEVSGRINTLVGNYQKHLGSVEKEVNQQLREQTREQDRANREYQKFLEDLGTEAQDTNQAEQEKLSSAINLFYTEKEATSRENQDLLAGFASKLPFSRNQSTLNKDVVEFTVAPLAFTDTQVRPLASVNEQRQKQLLRDQVWLIAVLSLCTLLALLGGIAGKIRKDYKSAGDEDE